jgi:hypothetical protein
VAVADCALAKLPPALIVCKECGILVPPGTRTAHLSDVHGIERGVRPHQDFFDYPALKARKDSELLESQLESRVLSNLKQKCGNKNITKNFHFHSYRTGANGIIDSVGVDSQGVLHIDEWKTGTLRRPVKGIGQLLLYKALIESDFLHFKTTLHRLRSFDMERLELARVENARYRLILFKELTNDNTRNLVNEIMDQIKPRANLELLYL